MHLEKVAKKYISTQLEVDQCTTLRRMTDIGSSCVCGTDPTTQTALGTDLVSNTTLHYSSVTVTEARTSPRYSAHLLSLRWDPHTNSCPPESPLEAEEQEQPPCTVWTSKVRLNSTMLQEVSVMWTLCSPSRLHFTIHPTNILFFLWLINTEAKTCGSLHFIGKKQKYNLDNAANMFS